MAAPIPTVPLSAPLRAQLSPTSLSRSTSFPIRAPLSSDDNGSDADTLSTASDGFETASDPDEPISDPIIAARVSGMPIAQLTGDDDVDEEDDMFEDVIEDEDEIDGEALPAVARIPVAGGSDSSDGEVFDLRESKLNESDTVEMANEEHMSHDEVLPDFKETNKISDVDGANFNQLGVESPAEEIRSGEIKGDTMTADVGDSELGNEVESSLIVAEGSGRKEAEIATTESGTAHLISVGEVESSPVLVKESEREIKETPTMPVGENSNAVSEIGAKEEPQLADEGDTLVSVGEVESSRVIVQEMGGGETGSESAETSSMPGDVNSSVVLVVPHETRTSESVPDVDRKTLADAPKLEEDLVSVQEVESPLVSSEESEIIAHAPVLAPDDSNFVAAQKVESPVIPSEELKTIADMPELAANDTDLVSVQEVEFPVMPSEESKTVADAPELAADDTDLVSVQEIELPVIPSEESKTVADVPELAADNTDLVSVQEVELPVIPSAELETVARAPELAANDTEIVSDQQIESAVMPSEESKTVVDTPELAANNTDLVSVQEVELPVMSSEESKTGSDAPELAADDTDLVSVQEVESPPILSEESAPKLAADGTNLVSFQEVESPSILSEESVTIAHPPVLAVDDSDLVSAVDDSGLVSVQEVESSLTPSEESEIVAHAPELAADNNVLVSVQEVSSPPIPSEQLEIVAHAPELATNDSGLVSVQEVDSPLIPSEESENGTYAPELPAGETDIVSIREVESPHIPSEEVDAVVHASELAAEDSNFVSIQEVESPLILSEESETVAHAPELVAKYIDLVSAQEVKLPLIPSEELETVTHAPEIATNDVQEVKSPLILSVELETVTHVPEIAGDDAQKVGSPLIPYEISENVAHAPELDANAGDLVSGQEVESPPSLSGESGSVEELAAKNNNLVSVQEVKLPLIPSEELETVTHAPEMSANVVQEVESPLIPSEISEIVARAPELVADASDLVSVKEAESTPILSEESGSGETEREISKTSNLVGDGFLSRGTEREITLTSSMTDDRNVAIVSGETPTLESILGPEEKTACDVGGGTWSVQEVLSLPIPPVAEERESKEREREIPETSRITQDGNSATVSGLEDEVVADAPDLVEDDGDSESIQEAESPSVLPKELESRVTDRECAETSITTADGNSVLSVKTPTPVSDDDVEKIDQNTLESAKTKQIIEDIIGELDEVSSSTSTHSGFGSLLKYPRNIDGQIVSDSDEDAMDTDEEGGGKELFDSAALASLLRAATGASPDGSVSITSSEGTSIFSVDRPVGLGSSIPSLKPSPARPAQPNRPTLLDRTIVAEPESIMDDEERKLHEKFEQIRMKFLLLVQMLGHSPDETEVAKVLYRLSLVEGIRIGRQTGQVFSFENAKKKALEYEMNGRADLDFSCTILVLGKTGVGKSGTVNSIFGEEMSRADAFEKATTSVKEIVGIVHGVKIRVIDTPGLKASVMDQASNRRILSSIKKHTKRFPPDIVLYVDRMDITSRSFNDLPVLKSITAVLGSSIWLNTVVALTHAASAPPDGPNGYPLSYDMFVAQTSRAIQHSIGQAAGDFRLMNHMALVENHPSCRRNAKGESVLPNGLCWRTHMLLLCYSIKILSEANSILKLQEPSPGKLFGFRLRSPPFAYFLASLLQPRPHPKLASAEGGDNGDSDVDLDDLIDADQEVDEDEYDELPPFKPLRNSQIAKLTKEQRRAYFDEYDYRVRLLQKKQWKEELRRLNEMKRKKDGHDNFGYDDAAADYDQDNVPAIPVPLPDMSLPPSFDSDDTVYLYRSLEPTSQLVTRPVLEPHTWDHDVGYNYANIVQGLAVLGCYPAEVSVQLKKDKKDFYLHLDSSLSAKHGENASTLAGFDIQSIGKQLAYILRSDTKFKNLKKNKTGAGISITFLGETVATGLKIEDQLSVGKRVSLGAKAGAVRAQGDMAYKTSLEATLRDKDYPFGQSIQTLGLSLTSWRGDLTLESDLQSQFSIGRNSKMSVHAGLNNKRSGQITIRTSSSEHPQLALVGIIPLAIALYRRIWPGDSMPY